MPSLQLGSGSVDGIVGLATFQNVDRLSVYADVQGKLNTEGAQDFQAGNSLFYDRSVDYVLLSRRNMFLILEASVQVPIHRDVNGRQLAPDYSAVVGLRYLF